MILRDARVTIVGLGLMGGSLAAALSRSGACREVVGVARREGVVRTARELRFIHWGTTDLAQGVQGADLVVLATPVRSIVHTITQIGPMLAPDCVLLDVGSSKKAICKAMANLPAHVQPIGGHPMCGKESAGLMVAEPDLFLSKVFVLCPLERTAPAALALAREVVTAVGARELVLDPEQHDRMVALISHLPYLMSISLVNAADTLAADDSLVWRLAASGFRDTSRVAAGNPEMMLDILLTNREPIRAALAQAMAEIAAMDECLATEDEERLLAILERARARRMEVFR